MGEANTADKGYHVSNDDSAEMGLLRCMSPQVADSVAKVGKTDLPRNVDSGMDGVLNFSSRSVPPTNQCSALDSPKDFCNTRHVPEVPIAASDGRLQV